MIRLNRTTEYGLIALRHMDRKSSDSTRSVETTSAREIADSYGLPFEITAKTLQRLKDTGLIHSVQGARGGYTLNRRLDEVTLAEFLELMEGRQAVVGCLQPQPQSQPQSATPAECEYHGKCEIKGLMGDLNHRLVTFLSGIRLSELAGFTGSKPSTSGLGSISAASGVPLAAAAASSVKGHSA